MRDRSQAETRGALIRLQTLRYERRTREALRVARSLQDRVSSDPYLDARFKLNYAALLRRKGNRDECEQARGLLNSLDIEFGFDAAKPRLSGDQRLAILNDMAVALSRHGEHLRAIRIHERLLDTAVGAKNGSRVQIQLTNLTGGWTDRGFSAACKHQDDVARAAFTKALGLSDRALELGSAHVQNAGAEAVAASVRIRQSHRIRVQLELAALDLLDDPSGSEQRLLELRHDAEELVRASTGHLGTPRVLLERFGRLGSVLVELLRGCSPNEEDGRAGEAMVARAFLQPVYDAHLSDADLPAAVGIRHADACRMSGDIDAAVHTLQVLLSRMEACRGADYGVCTRVRERLDALDAA